MSKRDNSYYVRRLKRDYPTHYADLMAGVYPSPAAAFNAAGLRKPPSAARALEKAWTKATPAERAAFLSSIGAVLSSATPIPAAPSSRSGGGSYPPPAPLRAAPALVTFDQSGGVSADAAKTLEAIIISRGITKSIVMDELGRSRLNVSLWMALGRGRAVRDKVILSELPRWLTAHDPAGGKWV